MQQITVAPDLNSYKAVESAQLYSDKDMVADLVKSA